MWVGTVEFPGALNIKNGLSDPVPAKPTMVFPVTVCPAA